MLLKNLHSLLFLKNISSLRLLSCLLFASVLVSGCETDDECKDVKTAQAEVTSEDEDEAPHKKVDQVSPHSEHDDASDHSTDVDHKPESGTLNDKGSPLTPADKANHALNEEHNIPGGSHAPAHTCVVYFDYNKSALKSEDQKKLDSLVPQFKEGTYELQGHCDERGTTEYNIALGERRADAVSKYLVKKGVPQKDLSVISFGKDKPAVPNATDEEGHKQNRRVEIVKVEK